MRIVIVGNGVAGIEAAMAVRAREPDWDIAVVSEESDHFFSRTALMYVLSGQLSSRDIEPRERDLYAQLNLRRVRARATGVDASGHLLLLGGGLSPLPYDRLLIACGSRPRPAPWPGSDLRGIGAFVTLQDLGWLEQELHGGPSRGGPPPNPDAHLASSEQSSAYFPRQVAARSRGSRPASPVVVGGGLIGCEVVETLLAAGCKPRFLVKQAWFWPIALDAAEAGWVAEHLHGHGVRVELDREVRRFVGDDRGNVVAVETSAGRCACDLAVVAIGVVPNTDWLQGGDIALQKDGGICVDAGLRSSAPDVFAAGDCAAVRWTDGRTQPEQLWYTARDQGRVAGRALCGDAAAYQRGIWYNSAKFLDIEYTTAGLVNMNLPGEQRWFFEERGAVRSTTRIVCQEGRIVGFNALGRRWDHSVLVRWITERRDLPWVLGHLKDAAFDTELVPPLAVPPDRWAPTS